MKTILIAIAIVLSGILAQAQAVHFISGMGSDERIYTNIEIPSDFSINYVDWLDPFKREPLDNYASRIIKANYIKDGDIIIGTSFGGIVAVEISKQIKAGKTILISSISHKKERPFKLKLLDFFGMHVFVPKKAFKNVDLSIKSAFGEVTKEERKLLSDMIEDNDTDLMYWSLITLASFDNTEEIENLVKINGTNDKVFPIKIVDSQYVVEGNHLIVFNSEEVNYLINKIIEKG